MTDNQNEAASSNSTPPTRTAESKRELSTGDIIAIIAIIIGAGVAFLIAIFGGPIAWKIFWVVSIIFFIILLGIILFCFLHKSIPSDIRKSLKRKLLLLGIPWLIMLITLLFLFGQDKRLEIKELIETKNALTSSPTIQDDTITPKVPTPTNTFTITPSITLTLTPSPTLTLEPTQNIQPTATPTRLWDFRTSDCLYGKTWKPFPFNDWKGLVLGHETDCNPYWARGLVIENGEGLIINKEIDTDKPFGIIQNFNENVSIIGFSMNNINLEIASDHDLTFKFGHGLKTGEDKFLGSYIGIKKSYTDDPAILYIEEFDRVSQTSVYSHKCNEVNPGDNISISCSGSKNLGVKTWNLYCSGKINDEIDISCTDINSLTTHSFVTFETNYYADSIYFGYEGESGDNIDLLFNLEMTFSD